jgi:hypothetical protein
MTRKAATFSETSTSPTDWSPNYYEAIMRAVATGLGDLT